MEDNSFYGAPAGWYPDPLGLPQLRWWDSTAWTHQVAEARAPMVMQETTFAWPEDELDDERERDAVDEHDLPTRRERREQERRNNIDTPEPTALTLLELEPPSIAALQEPAVAAAEPLPDLLEPHRIQSEFGDGSQLADSVAETVSALGFSTDPVPQTVPSASTDPLTSASTDPLSATESRFTPESTLADSADLDDVDLDSAESTAASEFPIPMAATRAASLQEPSSPASADSATAHRDVDDAPFNWTPESSPTRQESPRAEFLKEREPEPVVITVPHMGTHNFAVWMIALIPLAQLVVSLLLLTAIGSAVSSTAMAAIWLAPYPLVIALAAIDRAQLRRTGHEKTAHWVWALFTAPIYLIVRAVATIRESGGGFGPVLVWAVLGMLHLASIVAVPGLLISALPTVFAHQAEQSIVSDAAVIGAQLDVTCPMPAVLIGQTFTCAGVTSSDKSLDIEVSLQRVNGWIDWRVDDWGIYTLG